LFNPINKGDMVMGKVVRLGMMIISALLILSMAWGVMAVRPVPGGAEHSGISSVTDGYCDGTTIVNTALSYAGTNGNLSDGPALDTGELQATIGYRQNMLAVNGTTDYVRSLQLNTNNATVGNRNLEVQNAISYVSEGSGSMTYDEAVALAAYGNSTTDSSISCPFGPNPAEVPAYAAQVVAGSNMIGVKEVALNTESGAVSTAASLDVPVSVNYNFDATGVPGVGNDTLAEGTATVYMTASVMGGNGNGTALGTEVNYNDVTTVSGLFDLAKQMGYSSTSVV
jgi:hypothetical protein